MSSATKKRKYSQEYLKLGFTNIMDKGVEKPQCVICDKVLGVDSLRPSKLKIHLESNHPQHKDKDVAYFQRLADRVKRRRLDADGVVLVQNAAGIAGVIRLLSVFDTF